MTAHLDREKAWDILADVYENNLLGPEALRLLEACVVPDPPTTIDRNALVALLGLHMAEGDPGEVASLVLALVRPAAGITLTPEEAQFVRHCVLHDLTEAMYDTEDIAVAESIAERIKEASA